MSEFVTRDGCRIHFEDRGSRVDGATTLVFLTGWSQTAAMFERLLAELGDSYRVVTWDYRNHGESGESPKGARIATLAADLGELLEHLHIGNAHFVGHSMGCSVLYSYIDSRGTAGIQSLTLIDQPTVCALVPWLAESDADQVGAILDFAGAYDFVQTVAGEAGEPARSDFLRGMLSPDISDADFDWLLGENLKLRMPYGSKLLLDHVMQDWRDVLVTIDVPSLVIGGEVSHVVPSSQEWTASQIAGAKLRIFTREEGGSHFAFFEDAPTFAKELTAFVGV